MDTVDLLSEFSKRYPVTCTIDRVFNEPARIEFYHTPTKNRYRRIVWEDSYFAICEMLNDVIKVLGLTEDVNMNDRTKHDYIMDTLITGMRTPVGYNQMYKSKTPKEKMLDKIEKVIFNDPATVVIWTDGTKTIVKAEGEKFDPEKGLAMALAKKFLGNQGNYYKVFKKWVPEEKVNINTIRANLKKAGETLDAIDKRLKALHKGIPIAKVESVEKVDGGLHIEAVPITYLTPVQLAVKLGVHDDTIRKECRAGLHPGAKKVNGKWMIPYEEK